VPGTTVDRQCGSSQQSVHFAAAGLISGQYDLVIAGGAEMMSRVADGLQRRPRPGRADHRRISERYGQGGSPGPGCRD